MGKEQKKQAARSAPKAASDGCAPANSPRSPQTATQAPVGSLYQVTFPDELVGLQKADIVLKFNPELTYAKVKFSFDNEDILISCERMPGTDCVFEFEFGMGDSRQKVFEIQARTNTEERNEPIVISCSDRADKTLGAPERYRLRLKPVAPPPTHWSVDLVRWLWNLTRNQYVRVLIILAVLIVAFSQLHDKVLPTSVEDKYKQALDYVRISWLASRPNRLKNIEGIDPLQSSQSGALDKNYWDAPGTWKPIDNRNGRIGLDVSGPEIGLFTPPDLYSLYDFTAQFFIIVEDQQRENQKTLSWVLRAQSPKNYYLFTLTLPTPANKQIDLKCSVYRNGKFERVIPDNEGRTYEFYPFNGGGVLKIDIDVKGDELTNTVTAGYENIRSQAIHGGDSFKKVFTLTGNSKYDYGTIGFKGDEPNYHMRIEQMVIRNIQ
jgi:hypothetical protein